MAAATVSSRYITNTGGANARTYIERVFISDIGAGTPATFTSDLAEIDGVHVTVHKAGNVNAAATWSGKVVSLHFTSPTDDNAAATVTVYGRA